MGHTFSKILLHIVFRTKGGRNSLYKDMRDDLFAYLAGIVRREGGHAVRISGVDDHVHLLVEVKPTCAAAEMVRKVKANSSKWIHGKFPRLKGFAWQRGYAAFSVSESVAKNVDRYIENQEAHHHRMPFAEELRLLLDRHGVEFEQGRYLD